MKTSKNTKLFLKKGGIGVLVIATLFIGILGVSAFFSDKEQTVNTFTVGKVSIEHHEEEWDNVPEGDKKNIAPNQTIKKDPKVENTGNNDAFIFQDVQVPCKNVVTSNEDGTKNASTVTDLFTYTINSGWTLIKTENVLTDGVITAHKYTYVYGTEDTCASLEPEAFTPTLFDTVTMANLVENQGVEATVLDIVIDAYAIQTTNLGTSNSTTPLEVYGIVVNQSV